MPLERVAEVRVESSLKLLQEPRFGTVYIVVKNKSDSELRVLSIRTNSSEYLVLTNLSEAKTLAPKTEEVFPWKIYAGPRVQSGKHLLLFDVSLAWDDEGRPQTGNILCKYECDVGVLGDSEFLVPLGVPSFLLLPGFLIVTVFAMLWNLFHKEKQFPWTAKSAEFWSLAVILSLIALLAVYWLTKRNVMEAYGLRDVYIVWFGSAAAGLLVWTAVEAIVALLRQAELRKKKRAELEVRLKTFTRDDEPVAVLRKLGRNGKGFYLNQVNVKFEGQDARGFVLQDKDSEHPTVCIAPSIVLSWEAALDEETRARLEKEFNAQVAKVDDPDALANLIETEKGNGITVKWKPSGALRKVTQVPDVAFEGTPPASLVKLE